MITIHQMQLTPAEINAVNCNESVLKFEAKMQLQFGNASRFQPHYFSEFYTAAYEVETENLEEAFEWTNLWNNQRNVDVLGDNGTSSSVGDIFELNGEFFLCAACGFEKLLIEGI
jgi:hypothetical protein